MTKLFVIFVYYVLAIILCSYVRANDCNSAGLRKYDSNIAKLMTIGNSGRKFPENMGSEVKKYCE